MLVALVLCSILSMTMASNYYRPFPSHFVLPWGGSGYGYAPYYSYAPAFYGNSDGFERYGRRYGSYGKESGDYNKGYGAHDDGYSQGDSVVAEHAIGNQGFARAAGGHDEAGATGHQASGYETDAKAAEGAHSSKKFGYFSHGSGPEGFYSKAVYGSDGFSHEASNGGIKAGAASDGFKKGYKSVAENEAHGASGFDNSAQTASGYADGHASNRYGQAAAGYSNSNASGGQSAGEEAQANIYQGVSLPNIPLKRV